MRKISEIQINDKELSEILADHKTWLSEPAGEETKPRANLRGANLSSADLSSTYLSSANLSYATLRGANLSYATLRDANLSSADLSYADLSYANLSSADLSGVNLSSATLSSANLRGANLSSADLSSTYLSSANLGGVNLRGANLSSAYLRDSNLSSANLRDANLSSADLSYADLSYATLSSANLSSADLSGVNLSSADLSGVKNLLNPCKWLSDNFEHDDLGYIVYKAFSNTTYDAPKRWKISAGEFIEEVVNPCATTECGCGVNFATLKWVKQNHEKSRIWRCRIRWMDLPGVAVYYGTDGKARCSKLELLEITND